MADQKKSPGGPPPLGMLGMKLAGVAKKYLGGTKAQDIKPGGTGAAAAKTPVPALRFTVFPYRPVGSEEDDPHLVVVKVPKSQMTAEAFQAKLHALGVELAVGHEKVISGEQAQIAFAPKTSVQAAAKQNPGIFFQGKVTAPVQKWTSAGCVVIPSMDDKEHVYVIKPANNYGPIAFPKGRVDKGESIKQAALREVLEETGLHVRILPGKQSYLGKGIGTHSVTHFFLAVQTGGTPRPTEETERVLLVTWDEAKHLFKSTGNKRDGNIADLARRALKQYD